MVTVRQEVVRAWFAGMPAQWPETQLRGAAFLLLERVPAAMTDEVARLQELARLMRGEFRSGQKGRSAALNALGLCVFVGLQRLLAAEWMHQSLKPGDRISLTGPYGRRQFVHEAAKQQFENDFRGRKAYLCGPPPMHSRCEARSSRGCNQCIG